MTDFAPTDRILPWAEVRSLTSLSRFLVRQLEAEGRFPIRVAMGVRRVGWVQSEVVAFLEARKAERLDHSATAQAKALRTPSVWSRIADTADLLTAEDA
jgi:prophage regulatory protein